MSEFPDTSTAPSRMNINCVSEEEPGNVVFDNSHRSPDLSLGSFQELPGEQHRTVTRSRREFSYTGCSWSAVKTTFATSLCTSGPS